MDATYRSYYDIGRVAQSLERVMLCVAETTACYVAAAELL